MTDVDMRRLPEYTTVEHLFESRKSMSMFKTDDHLISHVVKPEMTNDLYQKNWRGNQWLDGNIL